MSSVLNAALGGMLNASNRLNEAARNIVQTTAQEANAFNDLTEGRLSATPTPPPRTGTTQTPVGSTVAGFGSGNRYIPSLAEEIVQLKIAAAAYKANARLARAADEILETTIDSFKR